MLSLHCVSSAELMDAESPTTTAAVSAGRACAFGCVIARGLPPRTCFIPQLFVVGSTLHRLPARIVIFVERFAQISSV